MKIFTEFKLVTGLTVVKFTELNVSDFGFLTFSCISYNWKVGSNLIMSGIETE